MACVLVYFIYIFFIYVQTNQKSYYINQIKKSMPCMKILIRIAKLVLTVYVFILFVCIYLIKANYTIPIDFGNICNKAAQTLHNDFTKDHMIIFDFYGMPIEYLQKTTGLITVAILGFYRVASLIGRTK